MSTACPQTHTHTHTQHSSRDSPIAKIRLILRMLTTTEAAQRKKAASSAPNSGRSTPAIPGSPALSPQKKKVQQPQVKKTVNANDNVPLQSPTITALQRNVDGLALHSPGLPDSGVSTREPSPEREVKRVDVEAIIQEVEKRDREGKPTLSLVVVGESATAEMRIVLVLIQS